MYNALFREFLTHMMEDPRNITACMHLHFIAKNIERMGDHATGIAEQVIYLVTGALPEEVRPKAESVTAIGRRGGLMMAIAAAQRPGGRGRARAARGAGLQPRGRGLSRRPGRQWRRGAAAGRRRAARSDRARLDAAQCLGDRGLPAAEVARRDPRRADHHAFGALRGGRPGARAGNRRRRLCDQALFGGRTDGAGARAAAPHPTLAARA